MPHAKGWILADISLPLRASQRLKLAVVLSALPLFGVVAAFGIAPDTLVERVTVEKVVESVPVAPVALKGVTDDGFWREDRIQRGDTVASLLARLDVDDSEALAFLRSSRDARPVQQLRPGKTVRVKVGDDRELLGLQYLTGNGQLMTVARDGGGFRVDEQAVDLERRIMMKSGVIRSSLFAATDAAGIPDGVAIQIAEIFSSQVDFHRDLRRGDRFAVVYESFHHDGEPVRVGRVLGVEFVNQAKTYQAVWFEHGNGEGSYYWPDGRSLRKAFLRSPLEFSRITSGFSMRFHPILQTWRAHRGIDYGAPTGTRVRSTGDGVITHAGSQGQYGNLVVVQHLNRYHTYYAHLSGFGPGIRKGARVQQGDIVGYVGQTGLATGPHLHYEFHIDGVQHDPLKVVLPESPPITRELKARFDAVSGPLAHRLDLLRETNLARLD